MGVTFIDLMCKSCGKLFKSERSYYNHRIKKGSSVMFCSTRCNHNLRVQERIEKQCKYCSNKFTVREKENKTFCSQSCSASFNNCNKDHGTRISKLEIWINSNLSELYPKLKILYNKKQAINSELDIYIPELNLAFELNGIFHYEPIHGKDLLKRIKNNDNRKFQACLEHGIELCIIDTSSQKVFKEKTSKKYLQIIKKIINQKMGELAGIEPAS